MKRQRASVEIGRLHQRTARVHFHCGCRVLLRREAGQRADGTTQRKTQPEVESETMPCPSLERHPAPSKKSTPSRGFRSSSRLAREAELPARACSARGEASEGVGRITLAARGRFDPTPRDLRSSGYSRRRCVRNSALARLTGAPRSALPPPGGAAESAPALSLLALAKRDCCTVCSARRR